MKKKSLIKMLRASAMAMSYYIFGDLQLNQAINHVLEEVVE